MIEPWILNFNSKFKSPENNQNFLQRDGSERIKHRCIELLKLLKPNLVKNRSNQHTNIINNTSEHINRLKVEFTKESATEFFLSTRFLFQNLDRVQLYDLSSNLLADTDTLDLAPDIFVVSQDVKETPIDTTDENIDINKFLLIIF